MNKSLHCTSCDKLLVTILKIRQNPVTGQIYCMKCEEK